MDLDKTKQRLIEEHQFYNDFKLVQRIIELDPGESVTLEIKDVNGKTIKTETFTVEQSNCHINFIFQDKGIKKGFNNQS